MRYIKKSETEPRDLREYKKNCRKASPPLKITYKDMVYIRFTLNWIHRTLTKRRAIQFGITWNCILLLRA